jgi:hypothetical protein
MAERKPYAGDTLELLVQQVCLALVLGELSLRLLEVRLAHLQLRAERTARSRAAGRSAETLERVTRPIAVARWKPVHAQAQGYESPYTRKRKGTKARTRASTRVRKPVHAQAQGYESPYTRKHKGTKARTRARLRKSALRARARRGGTSLRALLARLRCSVSSLLCELLMSDILAPRAFVVCFAAAATNAHALQRQPTGQCHGHLTGTAVL